MDSDTVTSAFPWKAVDMRPSDYVTKMNAAFEAKLYISALSLALTLPDVCSTASNQDSRTSGEKYKTWINKYFIPVIQADTHLSIQASDIYQVRNAVLHNGSLATDAGKPTRYHNIRFFIYSAADQLIASESSIGIGENPKTEDMEHQLTLNLANYVASMTTAVNDFLNIHPECDKEISKGRLAYSGIVDFFEGR